MIQKEFNTLKPGDKVRIVKEAKDGWDWADGMNIWLGKIMTVREINPDCIRMEEDADCISMGEDRVVLWSWKWYREMIECKVEDEPVEAKAKKEDKTLRKRFLNELTGERGPFTWSDFGVEFTQRWDEVSLEMVMECFDRAMEDI